jgi:hypothetical protein
LHKTLLSGPFFCVGGGFMGPSLVLMLLIAAAAVAA